MIIDYCAFMGVMPFAPGQDYSPAAVLAEMREHGINCCFVSNYSGIFGFSGRSEHREFVEQCVPYAGELMPVPVIDLRSASWEEDILWCARHPDVKGVRIAPNYHGYVLDEALCAKLRALLHELGLMLFLAAALEDTRFQAESLNVRALSEQDIRWLISGNPKCCIIANGFSPSVVSHLSAISPSNVYFDVSAFDKGLCDMERFVEAHGTNRLVFGSNVPFLYPGAVLHNLRRSFLRPASGDAILKGGNGVRL